MNDPARERERPGRAASPDGVSGVSPDAGASPDGVSPGGVSQDGTVLDGVSHDGNAVPDAPRLEDQVCFPLYACSRAVVKGYRPLLEPLGLTYTQYITMMLLWEKGTVTAREIGRCLYLDSGTLSPLLKRMEARGLLSRRRDPSDERDLLVTIAPGGEALRGAAAAVPEKMAAQWKLSPEESGELYRLLYKILT